MKEKISWLVAHEEWWFKQQEYGYKGVYSDIPSVYHGIYNQHSLGVHSG